MTAINLCAVGERRVEWLDGDTTLTIMVGRTDLERRDQLTWMVRVTCELTGERMAMGTGWARTLLDAAVEAADEADKMRQLYRLGRIDTYECQEPW